MPRNIFQVTVNLPPSFRNNINNNEVFNPYVFVRNRLYHFVFHRFALVYARLFNDMQRKLIEFLILLASLFCFITLIYVHVVFVQTPMTCLDNYKDVWQRNGILRVEVLSGKKKENYTLADSYWKEKTLRLHHFDGHSYYFYTEQIVKEQEEEQKMKDAEDEDALVEDAFVKEYEYEVEEMNGGEEGINKTEIKQGIGGESFQPILEQTILAAEAEGAYIMEFSLEYGFLRLRPTKRRELNISVTFVVLDPEVDECFGGSFNRFLLDNFLGYDNVLLASIKKMAEKKDQKGFVRNAVLDIEYIFINNYNHEKSYLTAGFVMLIFTLTISTLLRHSHHQIFIVVGFWMNYVISSLGRPRIHMWPRNLIPSSGAPVLTVILALVGMEAVMSDFFHDRAIALHVIVIVWFADLYDAVCCQSALSKRHWFRFFYLYHFLFYAYNYKFGGVYWTLTLMTSWLFTLHSMVFFFHHYELPRFLHRAARLNAAHQPQNDNQPDNDEPPQNDEFPQPESDNQPNDEPAPQRYDDQPNDEPAPQRDNDQTDSDDHPHNDEPEPQRDDDQTTANQPHDESKPQRGDDQTTTDRPNEEPAFQRDDDQPNNKPAPKRDNEQPNDKPALKRDNDRLAADQSNDEESVPVYGLGNDNDSTLGDGVVDHVFDLLNGSENNRRSDDCLMQVRSLDTCDRTVPLKSIKPNVGCETELNFSLAQDSLQNTFSQCSDESFSKNSKRIPSRESQNSFKCKGSISRDESLQNSIGHYIIDENKLSKESSSSNCSKEFDVPCLGEQRFCVGVN